jgi:branched-subunit amino acid ABC-type transport system permease component
LIAIGYTLVYGILRLINFAHGDVMMVATYVAYFGVVQFLLPWWLAALASILLTALLGIAIDRGAYLPVRQGPRISALITAIGVSFLLENLGLVVFGGRPKAFYRPPALGEVVTWGTNCRLDNLQAAVLDWKLKTFDKEIERRREIAAAYHNALKDIEDIVPPPPPSNTSDQFDVYQN